MKIYTARILGKRLGIVLVAVAAAVFPPRAARAQANWLQYQLRVSADSSMGNYNYFSGEVTNTNRLTTSISVYPNGINGAYATPSSTYGWLQLNAGCEVNNTSPNGSGYGAEFDPAVGGGVDVSFQDTLTITSSTLPTGTPVQVQISCVYYGFITPGAGGGWDSTRSGASVGVAWSNPFSYGSTSGAVGGANLTNTISCTAQCAVLSTNLVIVPSIYAYGSANNQDGAYFVGSIDTSITSQIYVDVLTPGASYTSASGTVYPTLLSVPPILGIQGSANGVILFWPVTTPVYRLQQNSDCSTGNWVSNSLPVSVVNGTNQVMVSPALGSLFFRLVSP